MRKVPSKDDPKKTVAQQRIERRDAGSAGGHVTVQPKGFDDGGGSQEQSDAARGIYLAASANRGDALGDPALKAR
jgi:hypothetical protein